MHTRFTGLIGLFSAATSGQPTAPLSLVGATGSTVWTSGVTPADRFVDDTYREATEAAPVVVRTASTTQAPVGPFDLAA